MATKIAVNGAMVAIDVTVKHNDGSHINLLSIHENGGNDIKGVSYTDLNCIATSIETFMNMFKQIPLIGMDLGVTVWGVGDASRHDYFVKVINVAFVTDILSITVRHLH